jgi:hypothetical protein
MSIEAAAWSPANSLPPMELPAQAQAPGSPGGLAAPAGTLTPDAAMPALGLEGTVASADGLAQAHAESAPWGSPADELAAGGQLRGLTEMARELARGSHALRTAEDSTTLSQRAAAVPGEALAPMAGATPPELAPATALVPGVLLTLQPGPGERLRAPNDAPRQLDDWRTARDRRGGRQAGHEAGEDADEDEQHGHEPRPPERPGQQAESKAADVPVDAVWCGPLLAALQRAAATAPGARDALKAAADAWGRGRAVLLACPSGVADGQAAWLFVLRPMGGPGPLRLGGERFPARLRWARVGAGTAARWWAVRVAKTYSLRRGGQLVTQDASADGRVSCELQLGPFPALPRWREALVRVDRVQRLWQTLGTQWSLPLLVCDEALLGSALPAEGVSA